MEQMHDKHISNTEVLIIHNNETDLRSVFVYLLEHWFYSSLMFGLPVRVVCLQDLMIDSLVGV